MQLGRYRSWIIMATNFHVFVKDVCQFIDERLIPESNTNIWHVGARYVVASNALPRIIWSKPMMLHLKIQNSFISIAHLQSISLALTLCGNPDIKTEFLANSHLQ